MEDSAFEALYTGVYVIIFITALSITIFLFSTMEKYSELAYEYQTTVQSGQLIENLPTSNYEILTGSQVISYYYNYIAKDRYSSTTSTSSSGEKNYIIEIHDGPDTYGSGSSLPYSNLKSVISYEKKYKLEYISQNGDNVVININILTDE